MTEMLQSGFTATARVGGVDRGSFNTFAGGQIRAAMTPSRSPGEKFARQIPSLPTIEPITVGRVYDPARETEAVLAELRALVGANMAVALWANDQQGQPFEKVGSWFGKVAEINHPDTNTMSDDRTEFTIVMAPEGV